MVTIDGDGSDETGRARRRRLRLRTAVILGSVIVAAAAVLVSLNLQSGTAPTHPSNANADLEIVGHSGSAVELAAHSSSATPLVGAQSEAQLAVDEEAFSLSLLRQLDATDSGGSNVVTSPSSLAAVLAMLELGARGSTASQIATTLGTSNLTSSQQAAAWHALSTDEGQAATHAGVDLESANSLWMQNGFPLVPSFMSALGQQFGAGVWQVDFQKDPIQAAAALNSWVSVHTHGRITQLFGPGAITPQTALILANAVYFKGAWQQPFVTEETRPGTFDTAGGGASPVSFMFSDTLVAPATKGSGYDAVQLPYKGGRFAALVIMPTAGTLPDFVNGLTTASLDDLVNGMRKTAVNLSMPRFQLNDSHLLNSTLESIGMSDAFGNADLSGMSPARLFVSQVQQKAFLKVTEEGTEAAAATGAGIASSLRGAESITVNHPFLFLIRDTTTGAILFAAEVENPNP